MRLAQRLRMAGFTPSAPPGEYKYTGFPSDENGVPDSPIGAWDPYGVHGEVAIYASPFTATENGTAVAVNIYAIKSSPAASYTYLVLYNGDTLVGTALLDNNPDNSWTGYIPLVVETGQSLSFVTGDLLRFGISTPDNDDGIIADDVNGVNEIMINYAEPEFTTKPPSIVTDWSESSSYHDLGAILEYSADGALQPLVGQVPDTRTEDE